MEFKLNLLETRRGRKLLLTLLYFTEGAPIGFIWWALPTLLRSEKVPVEEITGLTALLVLPWTLKFLWAPLVDALRSPLWGFRAWILSAQLLMGLTLLPLMAVNPAEDIFLLKILLLIHALSAATQDIAIDALAISTTRADERGLLNGCMQAGMLLGRSLFGGGALLISSMFGWKGIILGLTACILASCSALLFVREATTPRSSEARYGVHLQSALGASTTWWALGFALVSAAAFEAAGALAGPFLIDRQAPKETIGLFFALPAVAATLIGGLAGGKISDLYGRLRSVAIFLVGFASTVFALGVVDGFQNDATSPFVLFGVYTILYFWIGLFTAASYAMFMDLTDPKIGATQFSAFMAATNGCEAWSAWAGGQLTAWNGYAAGFFTMSAVSFASLPLLRALSPKRRVEA